MVWVLVGVGGWLVGCSSCWSFPIHIHAEPPSFVTKALQQTSVECTWDLGDEEVSGRNLSIYFLCACILR